MVVLSTPDYPRKLSRLLAADGSTLISNASCLAESTEPGASDPPRVFVVSFVAFVAFSPGNFQSCGGRAGCVGQRRLVQAGGV